MKQASVLLFNLVAQYVIKILLLIAWKITLQWSLQGFAILNINGTNYK